MIRSTSGSPRPQAQSVTPAFTTVPPPGVVNTPSTAWLLARPVNVRGPVLAVERHRRVFQFTRLVPRSATAARAAPTDAPARSRAPRASRGRPSVASAPGSPSGPVVARSRLPRTRRSCRPGRARPAVAQAGALEEPVLGTVHGVGAGGARHAEAVARVPPRENVSPVVEVSGRPIRRSAPRAAQQMLLRACRRPGRGRRRTCTRSSRDDRPRTGPASSRCCR